MRTKSASRTEVTDQSRCSDSAERMAWARMSTCPRHSTAASCSSLCHLSCWSPASGGLCSRVAHAGGREPTPDRGVPEPVEVRTLICVVGAGSHPQLPEMGWCPLTALVEPRSGLGSPLVPDTTGRALPAGRCVAWPEARVRLLSPTRHLRRAAWPQPPMSLLHLPAIACSCESCHESTEDA